jgi:hypothetical protein
MWMPPFPSRSDGSGGMSLPTPPPSCSEQWFLTQLNGTSKWMPWSWYLLIQNNPSDWIPYQWTTNYSAWTADEWQQVMPSAAVDSIAFHHNLETLLQSSSSLSAVTHTLWIPRLVSVNLSTPFMQQSQYMNAVPFHASVCPELNEFQMQRWNHDLLVRWMPWLYPHSVHWIEFECYIVQWLWFLVAAWMNQQWDTWSDQWWHSTNRNSTPQRHRFMHCIGEFIYMTSLLIRLAGWMIQALTFYCCVIVPFLYIMPTIPYELAIGFFVILLLQQVAPRIIQ